MTPKMSELMRQVAFKVENAERDGVEFKHIELWYDYHKEKFCVQWLAKNQNLEKPVDLTP